MSAAPPRAETTVASRALELGAAATFVAVAWRLLVDPSRINHDSASLLMGVVEWSEGRMPFAGFAGMNPPLISYFGGIALGISRALGWNVLAAHNALVFLFCLAALLIARRVLALSPGLSPALRASVLLGLAAATGAALVPELEFGQRDQLWAAGFVPFLLLRNLRGEGARASARLAVAAGLMAAFGCLLKPHFVLAALLCEGALALIHRRLIPPFAPEVLAAVSAGVAYAAHFLFLPRDYLAIFLEAIRATASGYGAFDVPLRFLLLDVHAIPVAILTALLALLVLGLAPSAPRRLAAALGAFTLVAVAIYLLQRKGFGYQAYPALAGTLVTGAAIVADFLERRVAARLALGRAALVLAGAGLGASVLLALGSAWHLARHGVVVPVRTPIYAALLEWTRPHEEVLFATSSLPLMYPALLETDRRGLGTFNASLMPVAFFEAARRPHAASPEYRPRSAMSDAEREYLERFEHEIVERRPRTIFVATSRNQGCPPGFSFTDYFRAAGSFEGALAPYRKVATVDDPWGTVEVYRRAPSSASPMEPATHSSIAGVSPG